MSAPGYEIRRRQNAKTVSASYQIDGVEIGRRIRIIRQKRGISQSLLARRTKFQVSQPLISTLETGVVVNMTLHTVNVIAIALGVKVWELLNPEINPENL